jgi:hypothetical protein
VYQDHGRLLLHGVLGWRCRPAGNEIEATMSDPLNPQTNDDTFLMEGTVTSIAVEAIGTPSVIFWLKDSDDVSHQMNGSLESEAVSRLGMLQLLRDALLEKRDVSVRYTVEDGGALEFFQVRVF